MRHLALLAVMAVSGLAFAGEPSDFGTVTALDVVGHKLGWSFHLTPPDPCTPPDPNTPPDPCRIKLVSTFDTSVRTDVGLDINIVGPVPVVKITVPDGFELLQANDGSYAVHHIPQ